MIKDRVVDPITSSSTPTDFKQALSSIRWFSCIGDHTEHPYIIRDWKDWPGPEDPTVMLLGVWQQELYDGFVASAGDQVTEFRELWNEVLQKVLDIASKSVPFDANQDTWHPPTATVWYAAWTAALVVSHVFLNHSLPKDLLTQWRWYVRGRWPCAYAVRTEEDEKKFKRWYKGLLTETLVAQMEENPNEFVVF